MWIEPFYVTALLQKDGQTDRMIPVYPLNYKYYTCTKKDTMEVNVFGLCAHILCFLPMSPIVCIEIDWPNRFPAERFCRMFCMLSICVSIATCLVSTFLFSDSRASFRDSSAAFFDSSWLTFSIRPSYLGIDVVCGQMWILWRKIATHYYPTPNWKQCQK